MGFLSVRFFNFRNLKDGELALGANQVFLVGNNGQGKTNLIEAIYLLCVASSFRESHEAPLVREPGLDMGLSGRYEDEAVGDRSFALRIASGKKREIRVDGKAVLDRKDLLGQVLCTCFVQQDMDFVSGSPEARRRFFDQTLALSDLSSLAILRDYRRVLRARNFVLKSGQSELLDAYDEQLASLGLPLTRLRAELVRQMNGEFSSLFEGIAEGELPVEISYRPSWRNLATPAEVRDHLLSTRGKDLAIGASTSGPHRDVFRFISGGKDFTSFASTGERRLSALILRVAQARLLSEKTGRRPVLLLDDVLLELDPAKKKSFISRLPSYEQIYFTFLPEENYLPYRREDSLVLSVEDGGFTR